ncbi:hypothetical protein O9G_005647 [Rozella allomycis CSF55]|uniref:Uncharacterized protein n=1 Tax=Rozella allomycis (strain CSF55) TaxID=988480 RepID=A0A075AWZ4_ROZAC|nr:hypothetical protein O9G_005647 [Rozella allomycis CSF55]|eukprot:EPZ33232.1 hypothetical protein O9G_005647 [Rozella allomycis CSF55]
MLDNLAQEQKYSKMAVISAPCGQQTTLAPIYVTKPDQQLKLQENRILVNYQKLNKNDFHGLSSESRTSESRLNYNMN